MAALKALLERYPNNFFVQSEYVNAMMAPDPSTDGWPSERGTLKVIAEYKALHERHPDDAVIEILYARTLTDRDTPAAIKLLDDALRKMPSFPLPNLDLVRIYTSPNFRDQAKAESHLSAFLSACPESAEGYTWLRSMANDDFTRKSMAQFRKVAETRTAQTVGVYPELWGLEFKSHPRSDYPALRKQVAADVARIRALNLQKEFRWWYALEQGYRLLGDQKQLKWAETESDKQIQLPGSSPRIPEVAQWFNAHPYPGPDAPKEKKQAYFRAELQQTDQWVKKYPNSRQVWRDRMTAMEALDDVSAAECATTLKNILQLDQANAGPLPLYWRTYFDLADFLSQKSVEPAQEVELARKGLDTAVEDWENIPVADLNATKDDLDYYPNFYWPVEKAQLLMYEAEGYSRLQQPEKSLAALGKANLQIQALNSDMTADPSRRQLHDRNSLYHRAEYLYWRGMARVAQLQGQNTDAMAYYQSALVARLGSDRMPSPGEKDELADAAHKLWVSLGGTENGWNAWYGERANALANQPRLEWETASQPLPPFRLTDLHGKTWQLADLKGKVVVLNFWATWCIYCREEFPNLEKLAEQYKNQPDVVFLSMDTDDDPGLVDPFLKQHKLTFPVLSAEAYATDTLKVDLIPQIWIVGPDEVVHLKAVGYDPTGKWVQGMKDAIDKFKSQAVGTAAPASEDETRPRP
ncbi:MAG: TlpA family protein disulfide reductase [Acidobacteriota bacterium]|nr:TlpA family protein disulfide reductase [Acidobacteriota bacterium]